MATVQRKTPSIPGRAPLVEAGAGEEQQKGTKNKNDKGDTETEEIDEKTQTDDVDEKTQKDEAQHIETKIIAVSDKSHSLLSKSSNYDEKHGHC